MDMTKVPTKTGKHNVEDVEALRKEFDWEEVKKNFSWHKTGKVNMAYEAIDRHAENPDKKDQVALLYSAPGREEHVTFEQLSKQSNKAANMLKNNGIQKGDRVFLFMPRSPEFYMSFFGILKLGAIAGPLFEAFMQQAVRDRLEDSEATMLITTPDLLERVPVEELPDLKKIILVGESDLEG